MTHTPIMNEQLESLRKECSHLRDEQSRAVERIAELEQENLEFANDLVQLEEQNSNLSRLYSALSRLHSTLDREEIFSHIKEVVINFVEADQFALFLFDEGRRELVFEMGEGFERAVFFPAIKEGQGVLGQVVARGEDYFSNDSLGDGSIELSAPRVAIPLQTRQHKVGVLAVYSWLRRKKQLKKIDYQLLSLLGEHAASALFTSSLYASSERKRQTYQGVVDLLIK